jgi:hypothetical protein
MRRAGFWDDAPGTRLLPCLSASTPRASALTYCSELLAQACLTLFAHVRAPGIWCTNRCSAHPHVGSGNTQACTHLTDCLPGSLAWMPFCHAANGHRKPIGLFCTRPIEHSRLDGGWQTWALSVHPSSFPAQNLVGHVRTCVCMVLLMHTPGSRAICGIARAALCTARSASPKHHFAPPPSRPRPHLTTCAFASPGCSDITACRPSALCGCGRLGPLTCVGPWLYSFSPYRTLAPLEAPAVSNTVGLAFAFSLFRPGRT